MNEGHQGDARDLLRDFGPPGRGASWEPDGLQPHLRPERDALLAILEAIADGVYVASLDHKIEYVNRALRQIYGQPDGRKCFEYFHDRPEPCPWCHSREVSAGKTVRWEWTCPKSGRTYDLLDVPLRMSDGRVSKLEIFRDITERLRAESALLESREDLLNHKESLERLVRERTGELESANRRLNAALEEHRQTAAEKTELEAQLLQSQKMEAVGRLAGGIAHDFNNLMTVVTGYARRVIRKMPRDDPARRELEQIRKAGERAAALTRQLLAFGCRQVLRPRDLDLNALIREMVEMLIRLLGEDVDVNLTLDPDLGVVRADPIQIQQLVMNLAVNSRDAMPKGGGLTIATANVELPPAEKAGHLAPAGRYVALTVRDTGSGMDEETQARIFEPFFSTKEAGTASGLGLSTVYGIVRQSGGDIRVYSAPGRGTTFVIYLPRTDAPAEETEPQQQTGTEPRRGSETVLLVEDEDDLRRLARLELEELGYSVLEAGSMGEALTASERHDGPIHLLLTDVILPGLSGPRLCQVIRQRRPDIRVLYVSGHTGKHLARHGVLEPGVALLEKPFTSEGLAQSVRELLDGPTEAD